MWEEKMDVHSCVDREAGNMENKIIPPKSCRPASDNIDGQQGLSLSFRLSKCQERDTCTPVFYTEEPDGAEAMGICHGVLGTRCRKAL